MHAFCLLIIVAFSALFNLSAAGPNPMLPEIFKVRVLGWIKDVLTLFW
jgi:hypothetical protein